MWRQSPVLPSAAGATWEAECEQVYHPNIAHDGNICLSVLNMPPK
ncbi:hypothetical protein TSOC_014340, partial [Tetrabaena socialis]